MKRKNYRKMLEDINEITCSDWAENMVEGHFVFTEKGSYYKRFTQEEAIEMAEALGKIYGISHGLTCVCGNKYRI